MRRMNSEAVSPFLRHCVGKQAGGLLGARGLQLGEAEGWLCDLPGSFWPGVGRPGPPRSHGKGVWPCGVPVATTQLCRGAGEQPQTAPKRTGVVVSQ